MIKNNVVDLTGLAFNIRLIEKEKKATIYFTLSMKHTYTNSEGNKVSTYNKISCAYSSDIKHDGSFRKSFEFLNDNLKERQLLRIQGMISSWDEGLLNGEIVPITPENKKDIEVFITEHLVRISDFKLEHAYGNKNKSNDDTVENLESSNNINTENDDYNDYVMHLPSYKSYS